MNIRTLVSALTLAASISCRRETPRRPMAHAAWPTPARIIDANARETQTVVDAQTEPPMRDDTSIRSVVMGRLETINGCYNDLLTERNERTSPQGTIELGFDIRPDGTVGRTSLQQIDPRLEDERFVGCVILALHRTRFPAANVSLATVTYPFTFRPQ